MLYEIVLMREKQLYPWCVFAFRDSWLFILFDYVLCVADLSENGLLVQGITYIFFYFILFFCFFSTLLFYVDEPIWPVFLPGLA